MLPSKNEHPTHYIERVRSRSSYASARTIIRVMFWLSVIAVVLISGVGAISALIAAFRFNSGVEAFIPAFGLLVASLLYLLGVILLRAIAVAYFDAVDVLIESNRAKAQDA